MTVKVTISADDREVTVETDEDAPIAAVVADALAAWQRTRPRGRRGALEAGGFGFQAERAEAPSYDTDYPNTARSR